MSAVLAQWVSHCSQLFSAGQGDALVASIPLDKAHPAAFHLLQAVLHIPESTLQDSFARIEIAVRPNIKDNFVSFLVAVLKYLKALSQADDGPQEAIDAFQRLNAVHTEANRLYGFAGPDGGFSHAFMNPFMVTLAQCLVQTSQRAASLSPHPPRSNISARSIRDTTRQTIEKTFQTSSTIVTESEWSAAGSQQYLVGDIIWPLANVLWRIYAERKLHTQASGLAKSLQSLSPNEDKRISGRALVVKQADVCESYYWRGKLGVVLLDMRNAKFWLDKAWQLCPANCFQQQRAILTRLIPVNLLLGYFPTMGLLQQYKLLDYLPLLQAFRTGNVVGFRHELAQNRDWYRYRSVWLLLYERAEVLVWRNLFRQALKAYYLLNPDAPKNRCPTWVFIAAAQKAMDGSPETVHEKIVIEDIICIISSLIDQSLILGHLSYSNAQLVMKPSPDGMGGFPRLSQVVPRHIEANV